MEEHDEGKMGVDFGLSNKQIWAFGIVLWGIAIVAAVLGG